MISAAPLLRGKGREGERRPLPGNSPNGYCRPKKVCADPFATHPPASQRPYRMRFLRHAESIDPMEPDNLGVGDRLPLAGPHNPVLKRDGRHAPGPSSAMSSDRLFLDRVARQQCPSPLHRRLQINTPPSGLRSKGDISTLPARGHFYFALTPLRGHCGGKVIMSPLGKVEMSS